MKKAGKLHLAGSIAGLIALAAVAAGGTGSAGAAARGDTTVIEIKRSADPKFKAPNTVPAGNDLQILNSTKPFVFGPHTFSLITKSAKPKGGDERRKCGNLKRVCADIADAHELNPQTFEAGQHIVENGGSGWDTMFDREVYGDSWYTDTEDETHTREVTAEAGTKFYYMCLVHPHMQETIRVASAKQ